MADVSIDIRSGLSYEIKVDGQVPVDPRDAQIAALTTERDALAAKVAAARAAAQADKDADAANVAGQGVLDALA